MYADLDTRVHDQSMAEINQKLMELDLRSGAFLRILNRDNEVAREELKFLNRKDGPNGQA